MVIKKVVNGVTISYNITQTEEGFTVAVEQVGFPSRVLMIRDVVRHDDTIFFTCNDQLHQKSVLTGQDAVTYVVGTDGHDHITVTNDAPLSRVVKTEPSGLQSFSGAKTTTIDRDTKLTSPLAGRILKVFVSSGTAVVRGQPLMIIESMKMENEICAPDDLFIKTILIAPGNVVQQNQSLIDFEKEGAGDATSKNAHEREAI